MRIIWTKEETAILSRMDIPFDFLGELPGSHIEALYDIVPEYMMEHTDTEDDDRDSDFNICENIITKLAKIMKENGLFD